MTDKKLLAAELLNELGVVLGSEAAPEELAVAERRLVEMSVDGLIEQEVCDEAIGMMMAEIAMVAEENPRAALAPGEVNLTLSNEEMGALQESLEDLFDSRDPADYVEYGSLAEWEALRAKVDDWVVHHLDSSRRFSQREATMMVRNLVAVEDPEGGYYLDAREDIEHQMKAATKENPRGSVTTSDIEQWIDNDEGLYNWWKSSRQSKREFIKENREELVRVIKKVTSGAKPAHYLAYQNPRSRQPGYWVEFAVQGASRGKMLAGRLRKELSRDVKVVHKVGEGEVEVRSTRRADVEMAKRLAHTYGVVMSEQEGTTESLDKSRGNPTNNPVSGKWNFMDYGTSQFRQYPTEAKLREHAAVMLTGAMEAAMEDEVSSWPIVGPDGLDRRYSVRVPKLKASDIEIQ